MKNQTNSKKIGENVHEIFSHYFSGKWSRPDPVAIVYSHETDTLYEVDEIRLSVEESDPLMVFKLIQQKENEPIPSPESLHWIGWL